MARLTSEQRKKLPKEEFAEPGKRAYPIPDAAHARNALARVAQHGSLSEKATVASRVHHKFPGIGQHGKRKKGEKKDNPGRDGYASITGLKFQARSRA